MAYRQNTQKEKGRNYFITYSRHVVVLDGFTFVLQLVRQEEELREEEEAYYEAKREAARVAKMQRQKEMAVKSNSVVVKEGKNAWLGDENEWEL